MRGFVFLGYFRVSRHFFLQNISCHGILSQGVHLSFLFFNIIIHLGQGLYIFGYSTKSQRASNAFFLII